MRRDNPGLFFLALMALGSALVLNSCAVLSSSNWTNNQRPYDYESHILHPKVSGVTVSEDTLEFYIELERSELLYLRDSPQSPFIADVQWSWNGTSHRWIDTLVKQAPSQLRGTWRVGSSIGETPQQVELTFRDQNRNAEAKVRCRIQNPTEEVVLMARDGWPLFGRHALIGDTLWFEAAPGTSFQHASIEVPSSLPAPPFTQSSDRSDTLNPVLGYQFRTNPEGWAQWIVQPGINLVFRSNQAMTPSRSPSVYGVTNPLQPLRDIRLLIESTRYITSRQEYDRLISSADSKAALDAFWLGCEANHGEAASMIATYYGRVEEANRYFSGILDGWRTDRGMVHIVFGLPTKVRKTRDSEWWIYGEEGNVNSITFRFLRTQHPWDTSFYTLSRSIQFRAPWDRMVTNWRNGRIQVD